MVQSKGQLRMPESYLGREGQQLLLMLGSNCDDSEFAHRINRVPNVDQIIDVARIQGVLPLLCSRMLTSGCALSPGYTSQLQDEYCTNLAQNLQSASELMNLLVLFRRHRVSALPFKGVALAQALYKKFGLRPAGDLDVLIYRHDLEMATELLIGSGYQLLTPIHTDGTPMEPGKYEYHFERSDGSIVELRWRLTQSHFSADLGMDWFWPRRQTGNLLGQEIPSLSPEHILILLCLHGSKHVWSRLVWLVDVAQLLRSNPDLNWDVVLEESRNFGLSKTTALGVLLCVQMMRVQVPKGVSWYARRNLSITHIAKYIAKHYFVESSRIPPTRIPYHVHLLGFGDKVKWYWHQRPLKPVKMRSAVSVEQAR